MSCCVSMNDDERVPVGSLKEFIQKIACSSSLPSALCVYIWGLVSHEKIEKCLQTNKFETSKAFEFCFHAFTVPNKNF